jgi:hypothetical protein
MEKSEEVKEGHLEIKEYFFTGAERHSSSMRI